MLSNLRRDWLRLRRAEPGRRFQEVYERRRKRKRTRWSRPIWLAAGGFLVATGPLAGMIPGPGGVVVFFVGLALLGRELRPVARALDWCEPRLRRAWRRIRLAWGRAATPTRITV
jgi:hypothetical protein